MLAFRQRGETPSLARCASFPSMSSLSWISASDTKGRGSEFQGPETLRSLEAGKRATFAQQSQELQRTRTTYDVHTTSVLPQCPPIHASKRPISTLVELRREEPAVQRGLTLDMVVAPAPRNEKAETADGNGIEVDCSAQACSKRLKLDSSQLQSASAPVSASAPRVEHWKHGHIHSDGKRKLCSLGTGEIVHILSLAAKDETSVEPFERAVQTVARDLYRLEAGITDVRVCHPQCGRVCFVVTFVSRDDFVKFKEGPELNLKYALRGLVASAEPDNQLLTGPSATMGDASIARAPDVMWKQPQPVEFECTGSLMPQTHTLTSLLQFFKSSIKGYGHKDHDVKAVAMECQRWFPREEEYAKYIHWDPHDTTKYTRNLIFRNEYFDCLLMCWPAGCKSAIHCHDRSSCWVVLVEGEVYEVQYSIPQLDKQFMKKEMEDPIDAVGRCGPLKKLAEARLSEDGLTTTYANNDIGVHRIENRSNCPAYTMHVYAPGLRKIKIFKDCGGVCVHTVGHVPYMSEEGCKTGLWSEATDPDGILNVDAWNDCV
ncbi:hypothetical protein CYMTET_55026 [Cymbomonas tetramitiformis]|uniref:cysteine dioxygenase n=1 Tax=Cymbomonas tetramitiformis TaxID=36881 RepID=A0AAE0BEX1_9CHLO|nr:hypothetical protein CYMTET_55026 [Cymbomonas tetramitiformis]